MFHTRLQGLPISNYGMVSEVLPTKWSYMCLNSNLKSVKNEPYMCIIYSSFIANNKNKNTIWYIAFLKHLYLCLKYQTTFPFSVIFDGSIQRFNMIFRDIWLKIGLSFGDFYMSVFLASVKHMHAFFI